MATPYNLVSRDAQQALTEFSTEFDAALAASEPETWAESLGLVNSSRAIQTTYPIPVDAAGYVLREGDDKLRSLFERSLSMRPVEWVDGVAELARIIEAPDFIGWAGAPARIALESRRQPNRLVAQMLKDNPLLDFYRHELPGGSTASTIRLFADAHPVNVFDSAFSTFDNLHSATAIDATFMAAVRTRFRAKKAPNGKPMGLRVTDLLVPAALEEAAKQFLESDLMYNATLAGTDNAQITSNNIYKGAVNLVVGDELLDDDMVYAIDRNGPKPWILQNGGSPEEIQYTKDDELYKNTGKVGVKYVLLMAAAAALPHAIERIQITG